jgi:hypothetical protein
VVEHKLASGIGKLGRQIQEARLGQGIGGQGKTVSLEAAVQELLSADELLKGLCGQHPLGVELHLPLRVLLEVVTTSVFVVEYSENE